MLGPWPGWSLANGFGPYGDAMSEGSGHLRALSWVLSTVTFVAGFVIGMTVHANLGAFLWICSAVFALLPFWSHRNRV